MPDAAWLLRPRTDQDTGSFLGCKSGRLEIAYLHIIYLKVVWTYFFSSTMASMVFSMGVTPSTRWQ